MFSPIGYSSLVKRAADDGVLAISLGQRSDLSNAHLRQLMNGAVDLVRRRLFEAASPARKAAINQVLDDMPGVEAIETPQRDFNQAQRAILALHRAGRLDGHGPQEIVPALDRLIVLEVLPHGPAADGSR